MKLSNVSIDRPVFTVMVTVAVLVLGLLALMRLGVDLFPNVSFPIVSVVTTYPGASPEEVETQVSRRIEEAVSAVNGVDEVRSTSRDSASIVIVVFKLEADIRQSVSDVRDRIALIRASLPRDVNDPVISRIDPGAEPVVTFAVGSTKSSLETRELVEDVIVPELESVDGVGSIQVNGGDTREVRVEIDRGKLEGAGLTVGQVASVLRAESFDVPGGRVRAGRQELSLRAVGAFKSAAEVGEVVLAAHPDGTQVRVRDVAEVKDTVKEKRTLTRVNGKPAVTFMVQKQSGSNTVAICDKIDVALAGMKSRLPDDVVITKVIDTSKFIRNNMERLQHDLVLGALLAVLVIFVFMLDWRSTMISAVALPTSVIGSFFVMWRFGFSLNIMTMMGLTLSIGMLIDDSVVVRENIFRHMERGEDAMTAARHGTAEIAAAVFATTMTILAVFVPVAFMGGIIGQMFRQFGLTVAGAVVVSLVVSFTLDPMLSARVARAIPPDHHQQLLRHPIYGPLTRAFERLDHLYRDVLGWALRHKKTVFLLATMLFFGSCGLTSLMGKEFFSRADQGELSVNIELPPGSSLEATDAVATTVEGILRQLPEVKDIVTRVGPDEEVSRADLRVRMIDKETRTRTVQDLMEVLRPQLAALPGVVSSMRIPGLTQNESSVLAAPVSLQVTGQNFDELVRVANAAYEIVAKTPGVRDPAITFRPGTPEQRFAVDRARAADRGVQFAVLASTMRAAIEGDVVARIDAGNRSIDVRVQMRPEDRADIEDVGQLSMMTPQGFVRVAEVTNLIQSPTPATIERLDRQRQITITANVQGRSLGEVLPDIQKGLDAMPHAEGYTFTFGGEAKNMRETFQNMLLALALAVIFIYLVLASQFESVIHPLTIMLALPLAIVGALSALFLADLPLGMPSMIGIILLMGLVTKNGILLVDYTNQLRDKGKNAMDALLEAGPTRLRPILMTSAAMILGMVPTALGTGEGSEFRRPQAVGVIGGIITSTVLTLVVVPVVYVWLDRFSLKSRREKKAVAPPAE